LSFPIFAATFVLAKPLTVLLLGEQYQSSAIILGVLALACYIHTSLGFNSQTLRVYGRVRAVVVNDVLASLFAIAGYFFLIPIYGPLGAAFATAGGLVLHNLLNQFWLAKTTDVKFFDAGYLGTMASIIVATVLLAAAQRTFVPHVALSIGLTALLSLAVMFWNRDVLDLRDAFPALNRLPLFQRFFRAAPARH
jgi:O-antigen/teichoic acid export membrane protein